MPIEYKVKLNNGNENIGADSKSITVQEIVKTAGNREIAREVFLLNPLIPEQVTISVLENFCQAAANLMGLGHAVVLQSKGRAAIRIYPDIKLNGRNITLTRAQQIDPNITELTLDNAGDLAARVGVKVRARAECEQAFTKLLTASGVSVQRKETINIPKVLRNSSTHTTPTGNDTPTGDDTNDGND